MSEPASKKAKLSTGPSKVKARTALDETDDDGNFVRTAAGFRNRITPGTKFEPEAGRYHLYVALGCPWASGTLTALKYCGLEDVVTYSVVHPTWRRTCPDDPDDTHCGWHFNSPGDPPVSNALGHGKLDCDDALIPDSVNNAKTIRELYELAEDQTGKYTTPVLWDKKEKTIVNNESTIILKIFDEDLRELAANNGKRIFFEDQQSTGDDLNEWIYPNVNNGVYRCGFAKTQAAYEKAMVEVQEAFAKLEDVLSKSKTLFLTGDSLTWLDIRVYHTLVRYDPVYVTYFKTNVKRLAEYPNVLKFVRECYKIDAVKASTNIKHIKTHYFTSHPTLNTYAVIPAYNGPSLE